MNTRIKVLFNDKIIFYSFTIAIIFVLLHFIILLFSFTSLPPFIPLFNQMPWGELRLGTKNQIFIPGIIVLSIIFGNVIFSSLSYAQMPLASRILSATSLLIAFFSLVFIIRTLFLVL